MSASPPLGAISDQELRQAALRQAERSHTVSCRSWSAIGFTRDMTSLMRALFSDAGSFSDENASVGCLSADGSPDSAGKTESVTVMAAFTDPAVNPTHSLTVRLGPCQFSQIGFDGVVGTDETTAREHRLYSVNGSMNFELRSVSAVLTQQMADRVMVLLEGTKHGWMTAHSLTRFNIVNLSQLTQQEADGNARFAQTLTAQFSGKFIIDQIQESLPFTAMQLHIGALGA